MNNTDQVLRGASAAATQAVRPLTDDEVIALFELNSAEWCEKEGQRMISELTERGLIDESLSDSQLNRAFVDFLPTHFRFQVAHITKTYRMTRRAWQTPIFYKALNMFDAPQWFFDLPNPTVSLPVGAGKAGSVGVTV